ncbi:MAG: hypothetical protein ABIH38_01130 [Patescibacteria group bacterium]
MYLKQRKAFILPLAVMVISAVAFTFLVLLSVDKKQGNIKDNLNTDLTSAGCIKSGCSGQVCTEEGSDIITTCEIQAWYSCLTLTRCEKQKNGRCGWTENVAYINCMKEKNPYYNQN